jgi:glutamate formiminotransferase
VTLLAVPNISEGRRPDVVDRIAADAALLDVHIDPDHNRSVLTYGGSFAAIETACATLLERAVAELDISTHAGAHPRFGVVDVLPIVAYDAPYEDAVALAHRIAARAPMPVYMYADDLPELRRKLREPHDSHPTAGVVCVGVRGPLIAFNVNIDAPFEEAKNIARELRNIASVRALAFELPTRSLVQVSMNLTRPELVGPRAVFERIARTAAVVDAEIVGLVPSGTDLAGVPLRAPTRTVEDALRR